MEIMANIDLMTSISDELFAEQFFINLWLTSPMLSFGFLDKNAEAKSSLHRQSGNWGQESGTNDDDYPCMSVYPSTEV